MGKDLSLWHSLAAEIPCSAAIQGRLQRSEHCGTVAQSSELHIESIERIFTLFEIVRHVASGGVMRSDMLMIFDWCSLGVR
jgi:hypothetical protein